MEYKCRFGKWQPFRRYTDKAGSSMLAFICGTGVLSLLFDYRVGFDCGFLGFNLKVILIITDMHIHVNSYNILVYEHRSNICFILSHIY